MSVSESVFLLGEALEARDSAFMSVFLNYVMFS